MRAQLIVKGAINDLVERARFYGISITKVRSSNTKFEELIVEADGSAEDINGWFAKDIVNYRLAGFPAGSLLYWAPILDESEK